MQGWGMKLLFEKEIPPLRSRWQKVQFDKMYPS